MNKYYLQTLAKYECVFWRFISVRYVNKHLHYVITMILLSLTTSLISLSMHLFSHPHTYTHSDSPLVSGRWDTEGCVRNDSLSNSTHIVCECTHLTNFAILLSAQPLDLPAGVALSLSVIGYIGVALSVVAMVATIVALAALK